MSKNKNKNRKKKKKKEKSTEWKMVEKPGDSIMPVCTSCKKRPVSDARKATCGRCSISYKGTGYSFNADVRRVERRFCGF
jgi:hypothetical protein